MFMRKLNVLALFDGISCGQVALERIGIDVDSYYSSEIDKYAIQITQNNYPKTIQLGDMTQWRKWDIDWASIDLLTAGFPCQAWSVAGKQKGNNDPRGALVHDLIDIWKHTRELNPNLKFMFENVRMKKEFLDYINDLFGVEPVLINSALVSAQNRKRYYWTNIEGIEQPEDKGILLKDIVHENTDLSMNSPRWNDWWTKNAEFQLKKQYSSLDSDKAITMTARQYASWNGNFIFEKLNEYIVPFDKTLQILDKEVEKGKVGYFRKDSQANRVYYIHGKSVTLMGVAGGGAAKMGQYLFGCITPDRINKRQNGQRFSEGRKFYTLTAQDKHGVLVEGYIRKLTTIECCRLQTLPDNYTQGISNSQQYKCIGNGWTVDVISYIFKGLK
jgi:DNA (cytosine-5)-methyltransferase 3A